MQIDLFELLEEYAEPPVIPELQVVQNKPISRAEYDRIKMATGLQIDTDNLPWLASPICSAHESCCVLAVVPPDALCNMEYRNRVGPFSLADLRAKSSYESWEQHMIAVWNYPKNHGLPVAEAKRMTRQHRDSGTPIWMRIHRVNGKVQFMPECIVKVEGGLQVEMSSEAAGLQEEIKRDLTGQALNGFYHERTSGMFISYSQGKPFYSTQGEGFPAEWEERLRRERSIS